MRHRKTRDIIIELTSLLDVVMILIFAVMIQNSKLVEASNEQLAMAQEQNVEMKEELDKLNGISEELAKELGKLGEDDLKKLLDKLKNAENTIDSYEYMDDIVLVFNIGLENRYNNSSRCLTYGNAFSGNEKTHDVKKEGKDEWTYALNSLKVDVNDFINKELKDDKEDRYIYIVFSVDEENVYSSDFYDINKALSDIETKYGIDRIRYRVNYNKEE